MGPYMYFVQDELPFDTKISKENLAYPSFMPIQTTTAKAIERVGEYRHPDGAPPLAIPFFPHMVSVYTPGGGGTQTGR